MTSRHTFVTLDGFTQASSVIAVVSRSQDVSGMVTSAFVPLKTDPFPNLPAVVHFAALNVEALRPSITAGLPLFR
jgi:hypothetical protein